jgi:hypothetical protein
MHAASRVTPSQLSSKGSAFESYTAAIISNGFGGEVIELSETSDLVHLMDAIGISGAHQVVIKASIATWKKNPDAAFQHLAAAKVRVPQNAWVEPRCCCARDCAACCGVRVVLIPQ